MKAADLIDQIFECTTCGCGRPWDDHGKGLPTRGKKTKPKQAKQPKKE